MKDISNQLVGFIDCADLMSLTLELISSVSCQMERIKFLRIERQSWSFRKGRFFYGSLIEPRQFIFFLWENIFPTLTLFTAW